MFLSARPAPLPSPGLLASAGAAASLGASHVLEKAAIARGVAPEALAAGRGAAALVLVGAAWLALGRWRAPPPARAPGHVALIGAVASGVVILLAMLALRETSATNKGVVQAMYPVGTALFAVALLGERVTARAWAAFAVVSVGLALLMTRGLVGAPSGGDWMLLATVPLIGFCDAWSKRTLGAVDPLTLAAGRQAFGLAFLLAALPVVDAGALAGAFALLFYVAVDRAGVTLAAGVLALAPVLTAGLESALGLAVPGPWQVAGLALVVAGVVVVARETG